MKLLDYMFASLRRETFRQCSIVKVHGSLRRLSQSPWCRDLKPKKSFSNEIYDVDTGKETDPAMPRAPVWSVHSLLSSYPRPHVSDGLLKKLHDLSALIPPEGGTEAHEELKNELEEMMRLVEAVKLVDTNAPRYCEPPALSNSETNKYHGTLETGAKDNASSAIPDGRIWPEGVGMTLSSNTRLVEFEDRLQNGEDCGVGLLKYAKITKDGFYVVEADRRKK